jgi:hypothetical protein
VAGISATAGVIRKTGTNTFGTLTSGATGEALLATTTPAAGRTALELGTAATVNTGTASGNVPLLGTGGRIAISQLPAREIISLTPINDFVAAGTCQLVIEGNGNAFVNYSVTRSAIPAGGTAIFSWTGFAAAQDSVVSEFDGITSDLIRVFVAGGTSTLAFAKISGAGSTVGSLAGTVRFRLVL